MSVCVVPDCARAATQLLCARHWRLIGREHRREIAIAAFEWRVAGRGDDDSVHLSMALSAAAQHLRERRR